MIAKVGAESSTKRIAARSLLGFGIGSILNVALGLGTSCPAFRTHRYRAMICPEEIFMAVCQGMSLGVEFVCISYQLCS